MREGDKRDEYRDEIGSDTNKDAKFDWVPLRSCVTTQLSARKGGGSVNGVCDPH
jgi:hypothetical protein